MRQLQRNVIVAAALFGTVLASVAAPASASSIGTYNPVVIYSCDGSVRVAAGTIVFCDGSVRPIR